MKIYTKEGDKGTTKTFNGETVSNNDCLIVTNGKLDSLQAQLDKVIYYMGILPCKENFMSLFLKIERLLLYVGGEISGQGAVVTNADVEELEEAIDVLEIDIHEFVRFKNPTGMEVNEARVRTRDLERVLVTSLNDKKISETTYKYINRLSDYLFAVSIFLEEEYED